MTRRPYAADKLAAVSQGAPFEVFLSADDERPKKAVDEGFGVQGSTFTYAVGKLVLWSKQPGLVQGDATLSKAAFDKLSICNPLAAPYGAAAVETMSLSSSMTPCSPS